MNMIRSCGLDDIATAYVDRKRKESVIGYGNQELFETPLLSITSDAKFLCITGKELGSVIVSSKKRKFSY